MYSSVKVLEMLAKSNVVLSELAEDMPEFVRKEIEVQCPWRAKGKVMRSLME